MSKVKLTGKEMLKRDEELGIDKKTPIDFYKGNRILGYDDRPFKFVIGNRSAGKSFFWKCYCIKRFLTHEEEFIYIRRYKDDLVTMAESFFDDVVFQFPETKFEVKRGDFYINDKYAGTSESVTRYKKLKSNPHPNVMTLFFDEFLDEDNRYVKNEFFKIQNIYTSIARGGGRPIRDEVNFIFVANHVSYYNPYFRALGVRVSDGSKYIKGPSSIIEIFQNEGVSKIVKESKAGDFLSLGENGSQMIEGKFSIGNNKFIKPLAKNAKYMLTIIHDGSSYGLYSASDYCYYISSKSDPNFRKRFVFSNEDHNIDYVYIDNWRKTNFFPQLKLSYDNGKMFFTNHECKQVFLEIIGYTS